MYTPQSKSARFHDLLSECRNTPADAAFDALVDEVNVERADEAESTLSDYMEAIHDSRIRDLSTSNAIYCMMEGLV
jgi:hypothetical protein